MKRLSLLLALASLSMLFACQSPQPTKPPTVTRGAPLSATVTGTRLAQLSPVGSLSGSGNAWTYWLVTTRPYIVYVVKTIGNTIWAGTEYGVYRINAGTGNYINYLEVGPIRALFPIEDGKLWAAGQDGVFFFDKRQWKTLNENNGPFTYPTSMAIDAIGDLWLLYKSAASRSNSTGGYHFVGHIPPDSAAWEYEVSYSYSNDPYAQIPWSLKAQPDLIVIDRYGKTWWIKDRTLYCCQADSSNSQKLPSAGTENTPISLDLPVDWLTSIALDPIYGVWLGSDRGLLYSDGVTIRWVPLGQEPSLLHAEPRNIAIDTEGNAWVVAAQGVQRLWVHDSKWQDVTDFGLGPGINKWPLGTIAAAREGGIWATHGQDLWRFGGSTATPLMGAPLPQNRCRLIHLAVDQEGNVWSPLSDCTAHEIVFRPKTGEWQLDPPNTYVPQWAPWLSDNLPAVGTIQDETIGPDGRVWIVGDRGVAMYDPRKDWQP